MISKGYFMSESYYGDLMVIGMLGCEKFIDQVDFYLREWRRHGDEDATFVTMADCPRFGSGEGSTQVFITHMQYLDLLLARK